MDDEEFENLVSVIGLSCGSDIPTVSAIGGVVSLEWWDGPHQLRLEIPPDRPAQFHYRNIHSGMSWKSGG